MIRMCLCPHCKTIQKHGNKCGICGSIVDPLIVDVVGEPKETEEERRMALQKTWDRVEGPWLETHEFVD